MLESLCYEGECIVSSRVVVTRAFTKRIFRLNFGYARSCFLDFTILKYYEDVGGGGATQSERSVVHTEGFA